MNKKTAQLRPYDEENARYVARIAGEGSANGKALKELERRREAGENVRLYHDGLVIVVGPIETRKT